MSDIANDRKNIPFLPLYGGDFLRISAAWTDAESICYLKLCIYFWDHGSLPAETARLAAITGRSSRAFTVAWPAIAGQFVKIESDGYSIPRYAEEREKMESNSRRQSANSIKRWEKERAMAGGDHAAP